MKLTSSVKAQITNDWVSLFPSLGVYKPMWLLRRVGPLVAGICLDRDSSNDAYRPTFHVHSLAQPSPTVTLTLAEPLLTAKTGAPETIRAASHKERYAEAAGRFQEQMPIALSAATGLDDVLAAYKRYMTQPLGRYPLRLYEDIVTLLLFLGRTTQAKNSFDEFVAQVATWPDTINVLRNAGGFSGWTAKCEAWISNPGILHATVAEQITELRVSGLPVTAFESQ